MAKEIEYIDLETGAEFLPDQKDKEEPPRPVWQVWQFQAMAAVVLFYVAWTHYFHFLAGPAHSPIEAVITDTVRIIPYEYTEERKLLPLLARDREVEREDYDTTIELEQTAEILDIHPSLLRQFYKDGQLSEFYLEE